MLVEGGKIREARLLVRLPLFNRLYCWPFFIGYALLAAIILLYSARQGFSELLIIPPVLMALGQFLCLMSCSWSAKADARITCREANDLTKAKLILICPHEHGGKDGIVSLDLDNDQPAFEWQKNKFTWNPVSDCFEPPRYPSGRDRAFYLAQRGLDAEGEQKALADYGLNNLKIDPPAFLSLFKEHAQAPFFLFQVACVALWCLDEFWYYSLFTLAMLIVFESTLVQQRLRNMAEFQSMAVQARQVWVHRRGDWLQLSSEQLLPGDLIWLEGGSGDGEEAEVSIPCDLILLQGAVIVNEAMMSGESTPLLKEGLSECDEDADEAAFTLYGGTKLLQVRSLVGQELIPPPSSSGSGGVLAFVSRTGFGTVQGELIRTMLFCSEQVTANNWEALLFILCLLVPAIMAAAYVVHHGWWDGERSRYKLLLEAALIITAVVPPELPMELSLAVNGALLALSKFAIFCMEPFRIPLAGKLDICCFDKTGTLTAVDLILEGVMLPNPKDGRRWEATKEDLPLMTRLVMAACHGLFSLGGKTAGDPMERVTLELSGYLLQGENVIVSKQGKDSIVVLHRHPFTSALKRMSCLIRHQQQTWLVAKGAPEVIRSLLAQVPAGYDQCYHELAQSGARVLALAYRQVPPTARQWSRDECDRELQFAGFLLFRCPLKPDSRQAMDQLRASDHRVMMITGDHVLTALHTARQLAMVEGPVAILDDDFDGERVWVQGEGGDFGGDGGKGGNEGHGKAPAKVSLNALAPDLPLALTGAAMDRLPAGLLKTLLPQCAVFARASPRQKEHILCLLKELGLHTLMCGDGTNDVGALKQAHVGVALLDGRPEDLVKIQEQAQRLQLKKRQAEMERHRLQWQAWREGKEAEARAAADPRVNLQREAEERSARLQAQLASLTASSLDEEQVMVRLGDASVAAPFTSKIGSITACLQLIRQGRCTLVTTVQMYKILALNSLISAFSLSYLHLEGIRYGDLQVTVTGLLLAGCFLFLSRSQPLERLSAQRPQANIFNPYLLSSLIGQFALHLTMLYWILQQADRWCVGKALMMDRADFQPSLVNTAIYLLSLLLQISTFLVNYQVNYL